MPERQPPRNKSENRKGTGEPKPLFEGGWVMSTPQAMAALVKADLDLIDVLARHLVGDWGDLTDDEKMINDIAVGCGEELLSAYQLPTGVEIWVVTAANRQLTWLKLPDQNDPER